MFDRIITSKVRKELNKMNSSLNGELLPLKVKDDVWILKIVNNYKSYLIKFYDRKDGKNYINKYMIMEKHGINLPKILMHSDNLIVFEDYDDENLYKKINELDLDDNIIDEIAKWYKKLHSLEIDELSDYKRYFTLNNINKVIEKYSLQYNKNFKYICDNFYNISLKCKRLKSHVILNDFNGNSMLISNKNGLIYYCDFDNLTNGFTYMDIEKIKMIFSKDQFEKFVCEYGVINEDEYAIEEVVCKIINLYLSTKSDMVSIEDKKILDEVVSEKFYAKLQRIVEWL